MTENWSRYHESNTYDHVFVILNTILKPPHPRMFIISLQFTFQWMLEGWFLNDVCPSDVAFQMQMMSQ